MRTRDELAYAALSILNAVLTELAVELAQRQLPLPEAVLPYIPLLVVALTQLTRLLPSAGQRQEPAENGPAPLPRAVPSERA